MADSLMSCFSNIGGGAINEVALDFWHSGQNREDIGMEDLEHLLRAEAMEAEGKRQILLNLITKCLTNVSEML